MPGIQGAWDGERGQPIIRKILSMLRPKPPIKRRIQDVLFMLQSQKDKLDETISRLQQRDRELFEKTISAYMSKDKARAVIYASEVAEMRKMAQIVIASRLALEKVILRLETIRELGDVAVVMAPVVSVLKDLKSQLAGIIPETALELEEITNMMNNMLYEIGEASHTSINISIMNEEAKKILLQAQAIAEEKIKESFPQLPAELGQKTGTTVNILQPLPTSTTTSYGKPKKLPLNELERKVLEYAKARRGFIDVTAASIELNVTKEDILNALESLKLKGRVRI